MTTKKYELTEETLEWKGHILHRVKALRDFNYIKAGNVGGWVESEDNLSQYGDCWISCEAKVYGDAKVFQDAQVFDEAQVYDHAQVYGNTKILDHAQVYGFVWFFGNAKAYGAARVFDNAEIFGNTKIFDYAQVYNNAHVGGNTEVGGNAEVYGGVLVCDEAKVYDNAKIYGNVQVGGNAEIGRNAEVKEMGDYKVFQNIWSSGRWFTWTRSNDMWKVGCFYGTGEELIKKAYADSEISGKCYEMVVTNHSKLLEVLK